MRDAAPGDAGARGPRRPRRPPSAPDYATYLLGSLHAWDSAPWIDADPTFRRFLLPRTLVNNQEQNNKQQNKPIGERERERERE